MPAKLRTIEDLIEEHKRECSFFGYGTCSTRACILGKHPDLQFVGCVAYQTVLALKNEPIKAERWPWGPAYLHGNP
jgi:hypothetical protein